MSKAQRIRNESARAKIAAQQAAARKAEIRRRIMIVGGSVVVVVAVVIALVVYAANKKSPPPAASNNGVSGAVLPASVVSDITSVPASTLAKVGGGSVGSWMSNNEGGAPPLTAVSDTPLKSGGKPEMLYIGAEYCPYCAAMRWAMAVALSRFGHFTTQLRGFHSSPTDVYPNTPTLTFYKAKYSSNYLVFTPVENENIDQDPLQPTTAQQQALWEKFDTTSDNETGYPFIDFGNTSVIKVPIYDPGVLAGKSWAQVAAALHDPSSAIARGALGAANYVTAGICKMTGNKPGSVCNASSITKLEAGI